MTVPCVPEIDIDTLKVNSPQQPPEKFKSSRVPGSAVALMVVVVVTLMLVAICANIQRARRSQIETIVVAPAHSATPQPR